MSQFPRVSNERILKSPDERRIESSEGRECVVEINREAHNTHPPSSILTSGGCDHQKVRWRGSRPSPSSCRLHANGKYPTVECAAFRRDCSECLGNKNSCLPGLKDMMIDEKEPKRQEDDIQQNDKEATARVKEWNKSIESTD